MFELLHCLHPLENDLFPEAQICDCQCNRRPAACMEHLVLDVFTGSIIVIIKSIDDLVAGCEVRDTYLHAFDQFRRRE